MDGEDAMQCCVYIHHWKVWCGDAVRLYDVMERASRCCDRSIRIPALCSR
jgi:hypothetical protein